MAIIYDAQNWQAGRERIYFNKLGKETLSDRLCGAVWEPLVERYQRNPYGFKDVQQTIETALLAVKAELQAEKPAKDTVADLAKKGNAAETGQETTPAKPEKESCWWRFYEKTLKVIVDAVLEKLWPK